jgi:tetratricopeptide (TPR) repeat protein
MKVAATAGRIVLILLPAALLAGCVQALKEPPPLFELAGGAPAATPEAVDDLLAEAEKLFFSRNPEAVARAAHSFWRAAAADPLRIEGLIGAARAELWISQHAAGGEARQSAAATGVHAAQWCRRLAPADPACDYWLGAALGLQARERAATGLSALPEIEAAFKKAAAAAPELEEAGPDRALAQFYLQAPGWPTGPGDPELGLEHARRAVAIRPDFPPNLSALGDALAANGQQAESEKTYRLALDRARTMSEHPDAAEWIEEIEAKLPR